MDNSTYLQFDSLCKTITTSLQISFISFDPTLQIVDYTPAATNLICLESKIDQTIARGTDPNVWKNWTDLIMSSLQARQKSEFGTVKYLYEEKIKLLDMTCIPIVCPQSNCLHGGVLCIRDMTEKLYIEHEYAHAERLISIGKVAGKVAHELNNPLDGILRYVNLSIRTIEQANSQKAIDYLEHCRDGLGRMSQIITELLEFSRSSHKAFETSPLDKLIQDALRTLEIPLENVDVQLVRDYTQAIPHFKSEALFQVFCNLIKNAADAMQGKGRLTITLRQAEKNWIIEFHDSGPGVDPDRIEDLFKPFYTTKSQGRGTGLGLAICKDILSKLDGRITAENASGGGGLFTIFLPHPNINSTGTDNV